MKNIYTLTTKETIDIIEKQERRMGNKNAFTYYINNCVSMHWCPKWLWSAVCDIIYWEEKERIDLDTVWYAINEVFYEWFDSVEELIENICNAICYDIKQTDLYVKRIKSRYFNI